MVNYDDYKMKILLQEAKLTVWQNPILFEKSTVLINTTVHFPNLFGF